MASTARLLFCQLATALQLFSEGLQWVKVMKQRCGLIKSFKSAVPGSNPVITSPLFVHNEFKEGRKTELTKIVNDESRMIHNFN